MERGSVRRSSQGPDGTVSWGWMQPRETACSDGALSRRQAGGRSGAEVDQPRVVVPATAAWTLQRVAAPINSSPKRFEFGRRLPTTRTWPGRTQARTIRVAPVAAGSGDGHRRPGTPALTTRSGRQRSLSRTGLRPGPPHFGPRSWGNRRPSSAQPAPDHAWANGSQAARQPCPQPVAAPIGRSGDCVGEARVPDCRAEAPPSGSLSWLGGVPQRDAQGSRQQLQAWDCAPGASNPAGQTPSTRLPSNADALRSLPHPPSPPQRFLAALLRSAPAEGLPRPRAAGRRRTRPSFLPADAAPARSCAG